PSVCTRARRPGPEDRTAEAGLKVSFGFGVPARHHQRHEVVHFFFDEPPRCRRELRKPGRVEVLAETGEALRLFVLRSFGPPADGLNSVGNRRLLPVQWLGTAKPVFPAQRRFGKLLRTVKPGRFNLRTGKWERTG